MKRGPLKPGAAPQALARRRMGAGPSAHDQPQPNRRSPDHADLARRLPSPPSLAEGAPGRGSPEGEVARAAFENEWGLHVVAPVLPLQPIVYRFARTEFEQFKQPVRRRLPPAER